MWPWGHAAVGYLLYSVLHRSRSGRPPSGPAALAAVFGSQIPDLIDKPLAWTVAVLPTGRSLGHSWLVATIVLVIGWWLLDGHRRALLAPLSVGWYSHGLADAVGIVLAEDWVYLGFLLWPVTTTPPYETEPSFAAHLLAVEFTTFFLARFVLAGFALLVWHLDGQPGIGTIRRALG